MWFGSVRFNRLIWIWWGQLNQVSVGDLTWIRQLYAVVAQHRLIMDQTSHQRIHKLLDTFETVLVWRGPFLRVARYRLRGTAKYSERVTLNYTAGKPSARGLDDPVVRIC